MYKRILIIIICFILFGCYNDNKKDGDFNSLTDGNCIFKFNHETGEIILNSIILEKDGDYYGVDLSTDTAYGKGVYYQSGDNFFKTSDGLYVEITDENVDTGNSNNKGFASVQKLDNKLYVIVSGPEKKDVDTVVSRIFKIDGINFGFLGHDIHPSWYGDYSITPEVVRFSNGEEDVYFYQNPGSPISNGVDTEGYEPTVFMKQLRGIDIPITYPEDDSDYHYMPYGLVAYPHYTVNGFTPYSAYDIDEDTSLSTNYILLGKNDKSILNFFGNNNPRKGVLINTRISEKQVKLKELKSRDIDMSYIKDYCADIIASDNRYHFGILGKDDQPQYFNVSVDGNKMSIFSSGGYYIDHTKNTDILRSMLADLPDSYKEIKNNMISKIVFPTIKESAPAYDSILGDASKYELDNASKGYSGHGASNTLYLYLKQIIKPVHVHVGHFFALHGDYLYVYNHKSLSIYECIGSEEKIDYETIHEAYKNRNVDWNNPLITYYDLAYLSNNETKEEVEPDFFSMSCYILGEDSLYKHYKLVSRCSY